MHAKHSIRCSTPCDDDTFATATGVESALRSVVIAIRAVIAEHCGVEPASICPGDQTDSLAERMNSWVHDGWDAVEFLMDLEEKLGATLPIGPESLPQFATGRLFIWKTEAKHTLAEWARDVAEQIGKASPAD